MSQDPPDTHLGDIDTLFCAVTARLRRIADGRVEAIPARAGAPLPDPTGTVRACVLDCVTELDRLHSMLAHEIERRERLERIVSEAQAALERSPSDIVAVLDPTLRALLPSRLTARAHEASRSA